MARPAVILVGADKGGVGKTTVARTLLDYFGAHQTPVRAFDTESPRGTLKRFHPDVTEVVDVTAVPDQMKIFDTLGNAKGQITFAVFHILGPSIASLQEIAETARFVGDASYYLVKNHINDTSFFEWDPATYDSYFKHIKGAEEITIPKLNEMACEQVEVAGVPYVNFVANKNAKNEAANYSFVLRGYVRHWLGNVWGEFDRVKLIDLVTPKIENNVRQAAG
jgi:hypothetical protein